MEFAARDPWDELDEVEREFRSLDDRRIGVLQRLEAEWPADGSIPDLSVELAHRYGWSQRTALERIRIATALRELPALRAVHAAGRLSLDQLRWVTRFTTPETDDEWSRRAPRMTPNQLKLESERQARLRREEAELDHAARRLSMAWDEDRRFLDVEIQLAREEGVTFEQAVIHAARDLELDTDADDPRAARLADAAVGLVSSSTSGRQRPTLILHTDVETLSGTRDGTRHLGESSAGIQFHADAIRRIGCMSKVRVAVEREGSLVGLASASRGPTDAQLDALWFRDRHCTFPGCEVRRFVEAHHIRHWADGGETTLENLTLLCGKHHRMLHEGGWTIRGRPPDGLEFVDRWERVRTGVVPELPRAG